MRSYTTLLAIVLIMFSCQSDKAGASTSNATATKTKNTAGDNGKSTSYTPEQVERNYDLSKELSGDPIVGPVVLTGTVANGRGLSGKVVRLYETEGKEIFQIDSAIVKNGQFRFDLDNAKMGLYRIGIFPDERSLGRIILSPNEKDVHMNMASTSFTKKVTVENSKENEAYAKYQAEVEKNKAALSAIRKTKASKEVKLKQIYDEQAKLKGIEDRLASEYPGTFFEKMVRRMQSPYRFDKEKFWNDIDFKDENLIHSKVYSNRIMDYMRIHAKEENTKEDPELGFYNAVDLLANKIKEGGNDQVLEFMLYTMSEGMYSSGHDDVSLYIIDNYFYGDACGDAEISELFKRRAAGVRNLQVGNEPPLFAMKGHDGKTVNLEKIMKESEYTLVFFWASYCHNCEAEIPKLKNYYEKYKSKGFEVVGVSVDLQNKPWLNAIEENGLKWYNCADLKGWKGDVTRNYRVSKTPSMFLLNKNGKLLIRTKSANEIGSFLTKKFR